ncbi:hypothetical protein [Luteimonas sp. A501]
MSPFHRLGLGPEAGEREIKRAYAKALKQTRPDEDPVAFQDLNEAYQAALAMARAQGTEDGAGPWTAATGRPVVQVQFQMQVPEQGPISVPVAMPVTASATRTAPGPARDFDIDAFLREFAVRCHQRHPAELFDWLHAIEALYDIGFKQEVAAILHDWLVHDSQAPMLRSGWYEDLDRFFSFDFSSRLVPLNAARWAVASEKTTRYGERRPFAIRQLKRPFAQVRELLLGAMPGMNRRLGLLAWGLARDFGGLPPGIDQRQYEWYTRLADPQFMGRERWLSIAVTAPVWGVIIAGATIAVLAMTGSETPAGLIAGVGAITAVVAAALLAVLALNRWLRGNMMTSEKLDWWLGAGVPLALAVLTVPAARLPNPVPAWLLGGSALLLAMRHRSRIFDAVRMYLASSWSLLALLPPDGQAPVLGTALAATAFLALDAAYAWRHSLPFRSTLGNRWTRIGSYVAFLTVLLVSFALPVLHP